MKVTVKSVAIVDFNENRVLRLTTNETFKGIIREEDGSFKIVDDCSSLNINLSAATAMLCSCNDDIAIYRCCQVQSFTQRQLALLLMNAKLEIERNFIQAGDTIPFSIGGNEERVAEYDMFATTIYSVSLSAKAQHRLDEALAL